jgi:hypothetical protein
MEKNVMHEVTNRDAEKIGNCAEQNANDCNFELGSLCKSCSVWIDKNVPRNCAWVRKD